MRVLFVHQNFPAQFKHIAPRLAADYGWDSTFVTARGDERSLPGVRKVVYRPAHLPADAGHACVRPFDTAAAHALGVFTALKNRPDVPPPDLVVAHSGFGSSLFLPHAYDAPVINFFEYYFHPVGQELGYRPDERVSEQRLLRSRVRNGMLLLDLANC